MTITTTSSHDHAHKRDHERYHEHKHEWILRNNSQTCWTISEIVSCMCTWQISGVLNHEIRTQDHCDFLTQTILFLIIPFTGTYETNKLTCWHSSGFIAQLVRELGHGFESRWIRLKIFRCTNETIAEIVQLVWRSSLQIHISTTRHKQFFYRHEWQSQLQPRRPRSQRQV